MDQFQALIDRGFEVAYISHSDAILGVNFPEAGTELQNVLLQMVLPITEIIGSGGGETRFTQRLRNGLSYAGWRKHIFTIGRTIDGRQMESTSHEVDHVKTFERGTLACEIEWNNKDPFFDRDLENFKRLHAEGAISAGILITRGESLQNSLLPLVRQYAVSRGIRDFDSLHAAGIRPTPKQSHNINQRAYRQNNPTPFVDAWAENFVSNKYGAATTHWDKLRSRISRGVGNPCPLLLIGLPASIVQMTNSTVEQLEDDTSSDAV